MALREILIWPHATLATRAEPITAIDAELRRLAVDMIETMYAARGIGLAANQVGETKRIIVVDLNPLPGEEDPDDPRHEAAGPHVMINPEIIEREGEIVWEEGCLSVPGELGDVLRSETIGLRYTSIDGEEMEVEASGLMAVCVQHEIDHLDGVVFPERMHDKSRARAIRVAMKKLKAD